MADCLNETGKLVGKNVVLEVADGCADTVPDDTDWKSLAAGTSKTLDLAPNTTNSSADDANGWVEYLTTSADATISFDGEIRKNDKLNEYGFGRFVKYFVDEINAERQPTLWVRLTVGPIEITGYMVITALSTDGGTDDIATFTTEFHIADGTTVEVLLLEDSSATVAVTSITLDQDTITLTVGENQTLTPTYAPTDATNKTGSWASDNTDVATVDTDGIVTAVSTGNANITITATDSATITATCAVTVNAAAIAVQSVTFDTTEATLTDGGEITTITLTPVFVPIDPTDKTGVWASTDETKATVTNDGVVTVVPGAEGGELNVTFTTNDGGFVSAALITVVAAE